MDMLHRGGWWAVGAYTVLVALAWVVSALGNTDASGLSYIWLGFALFPASFVMVGIFALTGWDPASAAGTVGLVASYVANSALWFWVATIIRRRGTGRSSD